MGRVYLDHASSSPLRAAGRTALLDALDRCGADPGRSHEEGLTSRAALERAREQLATLVGARPREVVFTSCASEAIAAACWGAARRAPGPQVAAPVEHSAVRLAAARHGAVVELAVDRLGRIDLDDLERALGAGPALVHVQWANHEVGTRQPVREAVERCRARGVLMHVDAAQGVGHDPIDFAALGADLLSLSGPKLGAPMGTGALVVRRGLRLDPLLVGGDQERARRAGLEHVPGLVGLGAVAEELADDPTFDAERTTATRQVEALAAGLTAIDGVERLGDPEDRVPHILCVSVAGVEPQAVLLGLDRRGVAAHAGSSCATESLEPSPVLAAMGADAERSLRLSVGPATTDAEVEQAIAATRATIAGLRDLARS